MLRFEVTAVSVFRFLDILIKDFWDFSFIVYYFFDFFFIFIRKKRVVGVR